jgi:hypothetical protein
MEMEIFSIVSIGFTSSLIFSVNWKLLIDGSGSSKVVIWNSSPDRGSCAVCRIPLNFCFGNRGFLKNTETFWPSGQGIQYKGEGDGTAVNQLWAWLIQK